MRGVRTASTLLVLAERSGCVTSRPSGSRRCCCGALFECETVDGDPAPNRGPDSALLETLPEDKRRWLTERAEASARSGNGVSHGSPESALEGEPRPEYDPSRRREDEADREQGARARGRREHAAQQAARTLRARMAWRALDRRLVKPRRGVQVDQRVRDAVIDVLEEHVKRSDMSYGRPTSAHSGTA